MTSRRTNYLLPSADLGWSVVYRTLAAIDGRVVPTIVLQAQQTEAND